jgi:hypothetical protein
MRFISLSGVKPDKALFHAMLHAAVTSNDQALAESVLELQTAASLPPDTHTYNLLLKLCQRKADTKEALRTLSRSGCWGREVVCCLTC